MTLESHDVDRLENAVQQLADLWEDRFANVTYDARLSSDIREMALELWHAGYKTFDHTIAPGDVVRHMRDILLRQREAITDARRDLPA